MIADEIKTQQTDPVETIPEFSPIYKITIDPVTQKEKPSKKKMGEISNRLILQTGLTIPDLCKYLSEPYSYSWSGGLFNGTRSNDNWFEQSVFALDFDKGNITLEEAIDRLISMGIRPQFYYTTLSSSPDLLKFRIVMAVDRPVVNIAERTYVNDWLLYLFPEADKKCRDASRYFLGGRNGVILDVIPNNTEKFISRLGTNVIARDNGNTRKIVGLSPLTSDSIFEEKQQLLYNIYRKYIFKSIYCE